jgi:hypothetical protein
MRISLYFFCILISAQLLFALDDDQAIVEKIDKNRYRIEQLILDAEQQVIEIPANINMSKGLIEVLLCTPKGKVHESLLVTPVRPLVLQTALMIMGYIPLNNPDGQKVALDSFSIEIELNGKRFGAGELLWNQQLDQPVPDIPWIFVGSPIYPTGGLAAEFEQTLIATYNLSCILANGLETRHDDTVYRVNETTVPPKGTTARIFIHPLNKEKQHP